MTVNEAIEQLQKIKAQTGGDIEVVDVTEVDGRFAIRFGKEFDSIQLPDPANDDGSFPYLVCGFLELPCLHEKPKPTLTILVNDAHKNK